MKIEIESVSNGYIITIPPEDEDSLERKIVTYKSERVISTMITKID